MASRHKTTSSPHIRSRCIAVGINPYNDWTKGTVEGGSLHGIPWDLLKGRERKKEVVESCRKLLYEIYPAEYGWLWAPSMTELEELEMVLKLIIPQVEI